MSKYGSAPVDLGLQDFDLREVMYYLYLPVIMPGTALRLPQNLEVMRSLVWTSMGHAQAVLGRDCIDDYVYVSARKGWATPDNPLNRPGWHCDGFGTDDLNFVWWAGPGTRFLIGDIGEVPKDHRKSMQHFEHTAVCKATSVPGMLERNLGPVIRTYPEKHFYAIDPFVVHATPVITTPQWRQYVKVSISRHQYNLENNSHNYLFDYDWPMHGREEVRNDTHTAQRDYA